MRSVSGNQFSVYEVVKVAERSAGRKGRFVEGEQFSLKKITERVNYPETFKGNPVKKCAKKGVSSLFKPGSQREKVFVLY